MTTEQISNDKRTDRRSYLKKLALGALGIGALLSLRDVPKANAVGVNLDAVNTGTLTTTIQSSVAGVAFSGKATAGSGDTLGGYGESASTSGTGIQGSASSGSGTTSGVVGVSDSTSGTGVWGYASAAGGIGVRGQAGNVSARAIIAQGASGGQSANLQEWQNYSGTALSAVNASGRLAVGHGAPSYMFDLRTPGASTAQMHVASTNTDAGGYLISANDGNLFMAGGANYSGSGTSWTAKATSAYLFGGGAAGVRFYHDTGLTPGASYTPTARMKIDASGNVGIGTESPEQKLHVAGQVKATGFITGDITYANGIKTTEEGDGIAFLNQQGRKIAVLDCEGNFRVKGRITEDPTL